MTSVVHEFICTYDFTYNSHTMHVQLTCDSHASHMRVTFNSHVLQILQYLLLNPEALVAGWRARLYFYSSGTLFKQIKTPLDEWISVDKPRRSECLRKVFDDDEDSELFQIIGDIIFQFIKHKKAPFPGAMLSQEDYRKVPVWKRCLIFTFLVRIELDEHITHKYYEWTSEEFETTQLLFHR